MYVRMIFEQYYVNDMYNAAIVAKLTKQSYPILHPASYSAKWLYRTLSYPIQYHPNLGIRVTCK